MTSLLSGLHRLHTVCTCRCGLYLHVSHAAWSSCVLYVGHTGEVRKRINISTRRLAGRLIGTRKPCLRWKLRSFREKGTFCGVCLGSNPDECKDGCISKVSVRGDAAFGQITLDTCFLFTQLRSDHWSTEIATNQPARVMRPNHFSLLQKPR